MPILGSQIGTRTISRRGAVRRRCCETDQAAVGDRGAGLPAAPAAGGPGLLDDRAAQLLDALTRAWGVLPTRSGGKQVWTVLDQHQARPGWYDDRVSVW